MRSDDILLLGIGGIVRDGTASKRGHNHVTIVIDMDRRQKPVLFVTPERVRETLHQFAVFLASHGGDPQQVLEVVCDMSPAFISGINEHLPNAASGVDWFYIMRVFTRSVDTVRKLEGKEKPLPTHLGCAKARTSRPLPSSACQIAWIPKHRYVYDHDLPDW